MKLNRVTASRKPYPIRVVQFGEGNFLRAFIDWMVQEMNEKAGFNAGVAVVQPLPQGLVHLLDGQDGLYHLYLKGIKKGQLINQHQLIDCIQTTVNPYTNYGDYLKLAQEPELRFLISNTTEAGIQYDAQDTLDEVQKGFPAKVAALLFARYQHFQGDKSKGLIVLPCELIDQNGLKLKEIVLRYAGQWKLPEGFVNWVHEACPFYNTLVDRIVPGFPKDRIKEVHSELGYDDQLVVEGEQFHLFVVEGDAKIKDEFPSGQAGLNVVFTYDQSQYRTRKVRILNGLHTTMVPLGLLGSIPTVRECVEDKVLGEFLRETVFQEIVPSLPPMEGIGEFAEDVLERFKNPFIVHYLATISLNSFSKFKARVLPSILGFIEKKQTVPQRLALSFASLLMLYNPKNKVNFEANDDAEIKGFMASLWADVLSNKATIGELVGEVLSSEKLWGESLDKIPGLKDDVANKLTMLQTTEISSMIGGLISVKH